MSERRNIEDSRRSTKDRVKQVGKTIIGAMTIAAVSASAAHGTELKKPSPRAGADISPEAIQTHTSAAEQRARKLGPEGLVQFAAASLARGYLEQYRNRDEDNASNMVLKDLNKAGTRVQLSITTPVEDNFTAGTYKFMATMNAKKYKNGRIIMPGSVDRLSVSYATSPVVEHKSAERTSTGTGITAYSFSAQRLPFDSWNDKNSLSEWGLKEEVSGGDGAGSQQLHTQDADPVFFEDSFEAVVNRLENVQNMQQAARPLVSPHRVGTRQTP